MKIKILMWFYPRAAPAVLIYFGTISKKPHESARLVGASECRKGQILHGEVDFGKRARALAQQQVPSAKDWDDDRRVQRGRVIRVLHGAQLQCNKGELHAQCFWSPHSGRSLAS